MSGAIMSEIYPPIQKPYIRNGEIIDIAVFPSGMQRVALCIEYNGSSFHGFQKQTSGVITVQQCLELALSQVADEAVTLVCAGRTDAGVHSTNQIVHFDTEAKRPSKAWTRGVNALLPDTVSVKWVHNVSPRFHARFSALNRCYRYVITNTESRPGLGGEQMTWVRGHLDLEAMALAASSLVGEHDFSSFRASQCQARSPVRRVHYINVARRGDLVVVEVQANAFLHHMVRNIVGVLLTIAKGEKPIDWAYQVLQARDRCQGGVTAKPNGLYLVAVEYSDGFGLPAIKPGPAFFVEPLGQL